MKPTKWPGNWKVTCHVCGFWFPSGEIKKRWDGLLVCPKDFEVRHPQTLIKVHGETEVPPFVSRDADPDSFVFVCDFINSQGIADIGVADCARADYVLDRIPDTEPGSVSNYVSLDYVMIDYVGDGPLFSYPYPSSTIPAFSRLAISGKTIIDSGTGLPVFLRGWDWGHEAYSTESDAVANKQEGANIIRIPIRWWGNYGVDRDARNDGYPGNIDPSYVTITDNRINWCKAQGLRVLLFIDSNCGQNGTQNIDVQTFCDPDGIYGVSGNNFFTNADAKAKFLALWAFIANRYKNLADIYELAVEINPTGLTQTDVTNFYQDIKNVVDPLAPNVLQLIGPKGYASGNIALAYNPSWTNVIYTGDYLDDAVSSPGTIDARIANTIAFREANHVPVFIQQVGSTLTSDPTNSLLLHVLNTFNLNKVHYTIWEYVSNSATSYGPWSQGTGHRVLNSTRLNAIKSAFAG